MAWQKFGPIILKEERLQGKKNLSVDHAIFVSGWEDRIIDSIARVKLTFDAKPLEIDSVTILEFDLKKGSAPLKKQKVITKKIKNGFKKNITLQLNSSYNYQENIQPLKNHLNKLRGKGVRSVYIDITTLPKFYIQAIAHYIFRENLFSRVIFGYSLGVYEKNEFASQPQEPAEFPIIDNIRVHGPAREKQLSVILGAERTIAYALISKLSPDKIDIFYSSSEFYPEFAKQHGIQKDRIESEHRGKIGEIRHVDAFLVSDFLKQFHKLDPCGTDFKGTTFAGSTKPLALAVGLSSVATKIDTNLIARIPQTRSFPNRTARGEHFLYDVVSLKSIELGSLALWD